MRFFDYGKFLFVFLLYSFPDNGQYKHVYPGKFEKHIKKSLKKWLFKCLGFTIFIYCMKSLNYEIVKIYHNFQKGSHRLSKYVGFFVV